MPHEAVPRACSEWLPRARARSACQEFVPRAHVPSAHRVRRYDAACVGGRLGDMRAGQSARCACFKGKGPRAVSTCSTTAKLAPEKEGPTVFGPTAIPTPRRPTQELIAASLVPRAPISGPHSERPKLGSRDRPLDRRLVNSRELPSLVSLGAAAHGNIKNQISPAFRDDHSRTPALPVAPSASLSGDARLVLRSTQRQAKVRCGSARSPRIASPLTGGAIGSGRRDAPASKVTLSSLRSAGMRARARPLKQPAEGPRPHEAWGDPALGARAWSPSRQQAVDDRPPSESSDFDGGHAQHVRTRKWPRGWWPFISPLA